MTGAGRLAALGALALGLAVGAPAGAQTLRLQPDEALLTAQAAFAAGQYEVANRIAHALAGIGVQDPRVQLILSATEARLGRPEQGIAAGREGWQVARAMDASPALRYEIARNTAKAAFDAGRPLLAQYWLRRSLDVAPDAASAEQSGRDLAFVRDTNPWRLTFAMEAGPSDNLNGGAEDPVFRIGDFVIGTLGDGAEALSGFRVNVRVAAHRVFPATDTAQTVLTLAAETVRNWIDEASQEEAGDVTSRDLDRSRLAVNLRRDLLVGPEGKSLSFEVGLAQSWAGGDIYGRDLQFGAQYSLIEAENGGLWLSFEAERGWEGADDLRVDVTGLTLLGQTAIMDGEGVLTMGLTLTGARSTDVNSTFNAALLSLNVEPGWTIGPAELSFDANLGARDYSEYQLFSQVYVSGGRQDRSWGAGVDLTFEDWGVMGFAPVLSLRHGRTTSNVSRYDTSTTGISIGVASVF